MIIDGIEYNILLFINDENDEAIDELYFENFEKYNEFFREKKHTKYQNVTYAYTFVEMINGEPDWYSWTMPIEPKELSEEEIQGIVDEYREYLIDNEENSKNIDQYSREIHYRSDGQKHEKTGLDDYCYVCPSCLNAIEECECSLYPYYLVQIDRAILPIIKELNSKGYTTTGCCAGHPTADTKFMNIYICFDKEYDFDEPFPDGSRYAKLGHTLSFTAEVSGYQEALVFQQDSLDKLTDWAELLFEVEDDEIDE